MTGHLLADDEDENMDRSGDGILMERRMDLRIVRPAILSVGGAILAYNSESWYLAAAAE